ncbi:GTP-binding protein [Clostridium magnum]|uniref:CobW/HypB/UreG, nucleotide-binding domain n=1 Tax=Clostridium magnum DSM 2767 TaxID=1121326 RepID=A0A162SFW1_9CLOT|nr:GTP-binding protein [Clostridium magnum]KZL91194.1 CobW/HypB/UreG, nucleotide-binding domain [Clostridium magnum DSM 2767]SHI17427.1 Cobalamin synthesis protein cobW C-terminal domain-containing protein [Clostridium magnum DSM 2767]
MERDGFDVFEITSGCICCIMKKDFVKIFSKILQEYSPERVVIEPTGISILSEIIDILKSPEFVDRCTINSKSPIITANWSEMNHEEIQKLLRLDLSIDFSNLFYTEYKPCSDNQFDTLGIKTSKKFTEDSLKEVLEKLKESEFGIVIRGKGFLKGADKDLEFSYANGQYEIYESKLESTGKLCIIGKNINQKKIKALFNTKIGGLFKW